MTKYIAQVHAMCRILYANGLNIDYYPTNFIVRDETLFYIDYECNPYQRQWDFANWGLQYWSPEAWREKRRDDRAQ